MLIDEVKIEPVHISTISAGDTIVHNGQIRTVCKSNITRNSFTFDGVSLFGDSYIANTKPVQKVVAWIGQNGALFPVR